MVSVSWLEPLPTGGHWSGSLCIRILLASASRSKLRPTSHTLLPNFEPLFAVLLSTIKFGRVGSERFGRAASAAVCIAHDEMAWSELEEKRQPYPDRKYLMDLLELEKSRQVKKSRTEAFIHISLILVIPYIFQSISVSLT